MNQKRQDNMKKVNYVLLAALVIAIGVAGYFAGKSGSQPSAAPAQPNQTQTEKLQSGTPSADKPEPEQTTPRKPDTETTQKPPLTPEAIAKVKKVPATLKHPQGDYILVAVIEGADAIDRLQKSIGLIGKQRKLLATYTQQLNSSPASATELRKSVAGKINEAKKILGDNLQFMAKNYAYTLNNSYMLVPHEASLFSLAKVDGKVEAQKVHAIKSAEEYDDFVEKLDTYLRLEQKQAKAAEAVKKDSAPPAVLVKGGAATPVPKSDPASEQNTKPTPTPEMVAKSKELQQLYNYNPEKNYQIRLEKTALYARAARASQAQQTIPKKPNAQTPAIEPTRVTPGQIAKAKNVPATLKNSQGDYTLVTVVEGIDANRRLTQGLQVVATQYQRLKALSQQFKNTPAESVKQRELIASQIKANKKTLEDNLRFMAKNYSYSLKNKYVQVTHEASLFSVTKEDGKAKTKKVYAFKNSREYEDFQKKRDVYLRLKREQAKAAKKGAKLAPTLEMEKKSKELQRLYNHDPEKSYQIKPEKTALYARAAMPRKSGNQPQKKRAITTPEEIAKAKNVPAKLKNSQGDFTLVAVVEGASSNRILSQGLQVVSAQRRRLAAISQQYEDTPVGSVQQREMIAGQINEIKMGLGKNARLLAKKYGYSLNNYYVYIPHVVTLLAVTKVDGEAKAESVYVFKNSGEYEDFQKKSDAYLRLKVKRAKATKKGAKLVPTREMALKSKELQRLYKFNPEKTYQIRLDKGALYARPAR